MAHGKGSDEYKSVFGNRPKSTGRDTGIVDWAAAPVELLSKLICTVTSRGGAVRFGYTRDGGAYALGLYYGAESNTQYCRPNEPLEGFLLDWVEFYEALPNSGGKSPDQGKK
jgi:hypothetical protein